MNETTVSSVEPLMRSGCTKPSRPSVVSGESASLGRDATRSAASLTLFTSFPFADPGWTPRPRIVTRTARAENVSISSSPSPEPSSV